MPIRPPHSLSLHSLFGLYQQARAYFPPAEPGLYARLHPVSHRVQYLYYCPKNPNFPQKSAHDTYTIFAHTYNGQQTVRFDMTGLVSPSSTESEPQETGLPQQLFTDNFFALRQLSIPYNLEPIAYEVYLARASTTSLDGSDESIDPARLLLQTWEIAETFQPNSAQEPNLSPQPTPRWQNYTWLAWFPSVLDPAQAYSPNHLMRHLASSSDPLHNPISVTHDLYALQGYAHLFTHTKTVGPTVYRGLDHFCSDYVRWVLTDSPQPASQAYLSHITWLGEDDSAPLAARSTTAASI